MSKEKAKEFVQKLSTDKAAAEKFKEAFRAALVKAGKDAGFKFTCEELDAALTEMKAEISEDELKGVAGGGLCGPNIPSPSSCHPITNPCSPATGCTPFCTPATMCGPNMCSPITGH